MNYTIIPRGVGATTSISFDNLKVKSTPHTTQNKLQQLNYLGVLEHEQSQRKPMGIIALYPNALYSHFIQDNSTVNYTIDFEVRKTHWKYICMLTSTRTFFDLRIMNSRKEENFKRSEDIDGNIVFTSTHAMALSEKGNEVYSLVGKRLEVTEDHRIIISPLPLPSIAQVFSDDDTRSDKLYSHIYLYI